MENPDLDLAVSSNKRTAVLKLLETICLYFSCIAYWQLLFHFDQGSEGQKQKFNTKEKVSAANFDFVKVPEKVRWVLTDYSEDSWMPCIGNEKLPECTKLEWEAAFESITSKFTFLSSENGSRNN